MDNVNGCDLFLGQIGGILQAGKNIFASERRILAEKILHGVSTGEHSDYLMHGYTRPLDTGLSVTNVRPN